MSKKLKTFKKSLSALMVAVILFGTLGPAPLIFAENKKMGDTDLALEKLESKRLEKAEQLKGSDDGKMKTFSADEGLKKTTEIKQPEKPNYVPGEVLVKFKSQKINLEQSSGRIKAKQFAVSKSLDKKEDIRKSNISVLKIKDTKTVEEKIAELKNDPQVEYAEPNYKRYPSTINTNDTYKDLLWGLDNVDDKDIDAPEAWAISEGAESEEDIIVAVIDSGVAYNHPDLADNMWNGNACLDDSGNYLGGCNHGYDYGDNDPTPLPTCSSHGTHIAGTIGAVKNNGTGIIGIAPNVKIMALKFGFDVGSEIKAINFAIQNGAKVINASFGGSFSQLEYNAIISFKDAGGIFITAAGNGDGYGDPNIGDNHNESGISLYPCDYDINNIICVAATDQNDEKVLWSDYGAISVDVGAPGVNIYSTVDEIEILNETFESVTPPNVPSGWVKGGIDNYWATYDLGLFSKVLYGHVPSFPYNNNADSTIASPIFDLSGTNVTGVTIDFWTKCDTEYSTSEWTDYMMLEVSNDGTNFVELLKWDEPYLDNNSDSNDIHPVRNIKKQIPISYLTNNFNFRFKWKTNSSDNNYDGCWIDDVKITKYTDGSDEQYDYGYRAGTSMAVPHVAGLAALIWGYKSDLSYSEVKDVILSTGDSLTSLENKTTTGKRINAFNALNSLTEEKPPYAVAIDNYKDDVPVSGINEADVVYEFPVEGSITRFMAIYNPDNGIAPATQIGPVRSARPYFARTASEHKSIYAHAGGTPAALQGINNNEYNIYNLDALASEGGDYFWRDTNGEAPYNLYTSIEKLDNFRENIHLTGGTFSQPWIFSDTPSMIEGSNQNVVEINYENANYNVKWIYNNTDNVYYRQSYEDGIYQNYIDVNGNQVSTINLAVQYADTNSFTEIIQTEGNALLCREGKCINGRWEKDNVDSNVKFYINGNEEFEFKTGKLWVNITSIEAPDTIAPEITLLGNNPVNLFVGDVYEDAGAIAEDNIDGDITENIITVNPVDTSTIGTYTVTYNVLDVAGNPAEEKTRTVVVSEAPPVNTPPEMVSVVLLPNPAYTNDSINTIAFAFDNDIDIVTLSYQWKKNGEDVGENNLTLSSDNFVKGDEIKVVVTPNDGKVDGEPMESDPIIISNSAPTQPTVSISPDPAYTDNDLTCNASDSTDIDDDELSYLYQWYKNDVIQEGYTSNEILSSLTNVGDVWKCEVVANDGVENSSVGESSILISETPDTIPPVITLLGDNPVELCTGPTCVTDYQEAGATALDNVDGDITSSIVIGGDVISPNSEAGTYEITYNVSDVAGNPADEVIRTVIINEQIVIPPVRSNGSPTGALSAGTTETTLSLTTDENATCRYSITVDIKYSEMTGIFDTTGGTDHSTLITGLTNGNSYAYYIRCQDIFGAKNTDDYEILFSVTSPSSGGGGSGGGSTPPSSVLSSNNPLRVLSTQKGILTQNLNNENKVKVEIPKGSIKSTTTFTASEGSLKEGDIPKDKIGAFLFNGLVFNIKAVDASNNAVREFSEDLTITLTVPDLPDDTSGLELYYFDDESGEWIIISDVEFGDGVITFKVNHLTKFALFEIPEPIVKGVETVELSDGDVARVGDDEKVYVIKIVGDKKFKRHIVSPKVFNSYGHLNWDMIKSVSSLDDYSLSAWVRNCTGPNRTPSANDKVYEVNADSTMHWLNMTAQQFYARGGSDEAIYNINDGELGLYALGVDVMYQ